MQTNNIKTFAQKARTQLLQQVEDALLRLGYNPSTKTFSDAPVEVEGGVVFKTLSERPIINATLIKQWNSLQEALRIHKAEELIEEVAYTWFNRVMAIKILSKNGHIPALLDAADEELQTPLIVQQAKQGILPQLLPDERQRMQEIILDDSREEELFQLLVVAFCRQNSLISRVFGQVDDYTQLLMPRLLGNQGLVTVLQNDEVIQDEDYQEVELIGWLYQFYISEKKDEVFASFEKKKKAEAADIPAATQIFTPNWIVQYMVQNTVGQIWLDANPTSDIASEMPYYIKPDESYTAQPIINEVNEIKLFDPACGSGHILVEGFKLLMKCYEDEFYDTSEAVRAILQYNLYGLDIDLRAVQLARFAVLLLAAQHDKSVLTENILPHIYVMPEKHEFSTNEIAYFIGNDDLSSSTVQEIVDALDLMKQAKNLGSIMKFNLSNSTRNELLSRVDYWKGELHMNELQMLAIQALMPFVEVLLLMTQQYEAVVANPPYMSASNFNADLKSYINKEYKTSKSDLMAVFMDVCLSRALQYGFVGMINQQSWMFLSSYENLRTSILENNHIHNMVHLGPHAFPEIGGQVVQTVAFSLHKSHIDVPSRYIRVVDQNSSAEKEFVFLDAIANKGAFHYTKLQDDFQAISGSPIAYWASDRMIEIFQEHDTLGDVGESKQGLATADNKRFLRQWQEVSKNNMYLYAANAEEAMASGCKWFPHNKGGEKRRWYGNHDYLVNWENDGYEIKENVLRKYPYLKTPDFVVKNQQFYFLPSISWSAITSGGNSFRYYPEGFIFSNAGMSYFCPNENQIATTIAALNTTIYSIISRIINPTLNLGCGDVARFPTLPPIEDPSLIENLVDSSIAISRQDWDAHETSWNFELNELVRILKSKQDYSKNSSLLAETYAEYCDSWKNLYLQLQANEEALNKEFLELYALDNEFTPDVPLEEITILQQGEVTLENNQLVFQGREIMSQLISYLMGCFMGRYRLDSHGLHIAHQDASADEIAPYTYNNQIFEIDDDAIVPLMDNEVSFVDNALIRIKRAVEIIWGTDTLVENINFIEEQLGSSLEKYLVKDFYPDHVQRYQKCPIYWNFKSKKGAFQVLVYMHRLTPYTCATIRQNYLLPHITNLSNRIEAQSMDVDSMTSKEKRAFDQLKKDLDECRQYDEDLQVLADEPISIDLDDGVKVNYAKFQKVLAKIK